ncbi:MAG: response regulator [Marinoscillum sp.]
MVKTEEKLILVVDDEQPIVDTICDFMEIEGYKVITAKNGEAGFFSAIKNLPDLIISDVMMPVMDGYEFLEAIRSFAKTKFIPFILLTAKSETTFIREGMQMGADDYIIKPFDHGDLIKSVKYRLQHHSDLINLSRQLEQNRMKMDLHDTLQQTMLAIKMKMERMITMRYQGKLIDLQEMANMKEMVDLSFLQLRNLLDDNPSEKLLTNGFNQTLESIIGSYEQYSSLNVSYKNELDQQPSLQVSVQLIPTISEILTNTIKHAKASEVSISITTDEFKNKLIISDNGVGFDKSKMIENRGFHNIRSRVSKIGSFDLITQPGQGTKYIIEFN